jgi:2-isopropylmalate synthase
MDQVKIFDTTLRDGEQAPGFSMGPEQKLRMAHSLALLGVDIIEAGFPVASPGDFDSVQRIAEAVHGPIICGLARCTSADIESVARAVASAEKQRIHVFIATSPIHRQYKLKMTTEQVIRRAVEGVQHARSLAADVEFSAEDASRTEPAFLAEVMSAVIEAGATTLNVPDTVGYATPADMSEFVSYLRQHVVGIERACISVHCHDDLGLGVANTLAAVQAGARQVECTLNGIGERAGNAALEEIVMALRTRADYYGCRSNIDSKRLYPTSRQLAAVTGNLVPRNKAIVGDNAFAHESGIHQHGMLAHNRTYEIMSPADVGVAESRLVLGKHSGRHAIAERVKKMGYQLDDTAMDCLFQRFKKLADQKAAIYDADLEALASGQDNCVDSPWRIIGLRVESGIGAGQMPSAVVSLAHADGRLAHEAAVGDGPLDAAFKAMVKATGVELTLDALHLRSVSEGEDAQGEAQLQASWRGESFTGHGVSTDIVAAGCFAVLQIINRLSLRQQITGIAPAAVATA